MQQQYRRPQSNYRAPECSPVADGPSNDFGYESTLGPESEPGLGSVLDAFQALFLGETSSNDAAVDDTLARASRVLPPALALLREGGDSVALDDAEATAALHTHLQGLLAEREAVGETGETGDTGADMGELQARIDDHQGRLFQAVALVEAEYQLAQAVIGANVARFAGPLMASAAAVGDQMDAAAGAGVDFQSQISMHLEALDGVMRGLLEVALREQVSALIGQVSAGAGAIGAQLGTLARAPLAKAGLSLFGEGALTVSTEMGAGAMVDSALKSGSVDPVRSLATQGIEQVGGLEGLVGPTCSLVLDHVSELVTGLIGASDLSAKLRALGNGGDEAIAGLEKACMDLLMGPATQGIQPCAEDLEALSENLAAVDTLLASAAGTIAALSAVAAGLRTPGLFVLD